MADKKPFKLEPSVAVVKDGKVVQYAAGKAPKAAEKTAVEQAEKTEAKLDATRK